MTIAPLISLLQSTDAIASLLARAVHDPDQAAAVYDSELPRGSKIPAIVIHRYGGTHDQDMSGPVDAQEDNFQLDIYGDTSGTKEAIVQACRTLLTGFTGSLPDGTVVQGTYKEQDRDMPFLPNTTPDNRTYRTVLAFRFVSKAQV
jgi:hypothetical protein